MELSAGAALRRVLLAPGYLIPVLSCRVACCQQNSAAEQAAEQVAALEEWVALAKARDEAAAAEEQAQVGRGGPPAASAVSAEVLHPCSLMCVAAAHLHRRCCFTWAGQAEAEQAGAECGGELEGLEQRIQELDAQLALGDMAGAKGRDRAAVHGGKNKKRGVRQEQEAPAEESAGERDEQPSTGKRKRRRRAAS